MVLPAGYCSPLHVHDGELHGLVLRGTLRLGVADSAGRIVVREYRSGSFAPIPPGRPHLEGAGSRDVELYVTGVGPLGTTVRDGSTGAGRCTPAGGAGPH